MYSIFCPLKTRPLVMAIMRNVDGTGLRIYVNGQSDIDKAVLAFF